MPLPRQHRPTQHTLDQPTIKAMVMTATNTEPTTEQLEELDGRHHAWCKHCYPQWTKRLEGVPLGEPFIAWCDVRAVILVVNQVDALPADACPTCADPATRCARCGRL